MKKDSKEYWVSVSVSWVEAVNATSEADAVKKVKARTKFGNGNIPKEYAEFCIDHVEYTQIDD